MVGKNQMVVGRCRQVFLAPVLHPCERSVVVGGCRCHDEDVVVLQQHFVSLVHAACRMVVGVVEAGKVDVDNGAFGLVLSVVNPANHGHQIVHGHLIDEPVFAMEADGVGVVDVEKVEGVDHRVVVAEETIDPLLLFGCHLGEALPRDVFVFLDESLVDH